MAALTLVKASDVQASVVWPVENGALEFPTGSDTGYRVVFDMIGDRDGWTVLEYRGARTWHVSGVGIVSHPMAKLIAMRLSR